MDLFKRALDYGAGTVTGGAWTPSGTGWAQGNDPFSAYKDIYTGSNTPQEKQKAADKAAAQGISAGKQEGLNIAQTGYGQGLAQTGEDIQRVRKLQQQKTNQADPVSEAIRNQKAGAMAAATRNMVASGVKGPAAAGAADQIGRQANQDIAATLYGQYGANIAAERSLAGNTLAGTTSLMYGNEGLANPFPQQQSWLTNILGGVV